MSKKKKSSLNDALQVGLACYGAYKILNFITKNNKKVRQQKIIENKQEKTPDLVLVACVLLSTGRNS